MLAATVVTTMIAFYAACLSQSAACLLCVCEIAIKSPRGPRFNGEQGAVGGPLGGLTGGGWETVLSEGMA